MEIVRFSQCLQIHCCKWIKAVIFYTNQRAHFPTNVQFFIINMENKEIFSALVAFSALDVQVVKNKTNPHFKNKYADLQEILEKVKKPLASCGLALYQSVRGENTLITKLVHISGESLEEIFTFKDASNMQGLGSAITYAKRYQICAMLGLAADDDDDGNEAVKSQSKPQAQPAVQPVKKTLDDHFNDCKNLDDLNKLAKRYVEAGEGKFETVRTRFEAQMKRFNGVYLSFDAIAYTQDQVNNMEYEAEMAKNQK